MGKHVGYLSAYDEVRIVYDAGAAPQKKKTRLEIVTEKLLGPTEPIGRGFFTTVTIDRALWSTSVGRPHYLIVQAEQRVINARRELELANGHTPLESPVGLPGPQKTNEEKIDELVKLWKSQKYLSE